MVRSDQNHRHRIAARKKTSASHRHQKMTIAEVYSGVSLAPEYLPIDISSGIFLDLCFHGFVNVFLPNAGHIFLSNGSCKISQLQKSHYRT